MNGLYVTMRPKNQYWYGISKYKSIPIPFAFRLNILNLGDFQYVCIYVLCKECKQRTFPQDWFFKNKTFENIALHNWGWGEKWPSFEWWWSMYYYEHRRFESQNTMIWWDVIKKTFEAPIFSSGYSQSLIPIQIPKYFWHDIRVYLCLECRLSTFLIIG